MHLPESLLPERSAARPHPRCAWRAGWTWFMALALGAPLLACRYTVDFKTPTPALVASSAPLPVTLSNELRRLRASASLTSEKATFQVGNLLRPLFPANDGRAFLSFVNADMRVGGSARAWETKYSLVVTLQYEGAFHRIQAAGECASGESANSSGRSAIEACVRDVYGQVAAVLERPPR